MYYVITKEKIYKFKAMKDMKDCDVIVPGSVVYNGDAPTQLMENFSSDGLRRVCKTFNITNELSKNISPILQLHEYVVAHAQFYNVPPHPILSGEIKINLSDKVVSLLPEPNVRKGSTRYKNLSAVLRDCFEAKIQNKMYTVADALHTLRHDPELIPPGGMRDVRIAIANKIIKVVKQ
tara:strand:- start:45 stop:578 length:534 start_codon:yes stop_codon:yes gene_type:complete